MQPYGVSIETAVSCYLRLGIAALQVPQSANCIFASQKQRHASTLHIKLHNLPTCKRREEANTSILVCIEMVNKESASRANKAHSTSGIPYVQVSISSHWPDAMSNSWITK